MGIESSPSWPARTLSDMDILSYSKSLINLFTFSPFLTHPNLLRTTTMISFLTLLTSLFLFATSVLAQGRPGVTRGQIFFGCYTARPTGSSTQPAPIQAANSASFAGCLVCFALYYNSTISNILDELWCALYTPAIWLLASINLDVLVWIPTPIPWISTNFKRTLSNCSMDIWPSFDHVHDIRNFPM